MEGCVYTLAEANVKNPLFFFGAATFFGASALGNFD